MQTTLMQATCLVLDLAKVSPYVKTDSFSPTVGSSIVF